MKKWLLLSALFLTGCAQTPKTPDTFEKVMVETPNLTFLTYQKQDFDKTKPIHFHIAHNGTPNPKKLMALKLAEKDSNPNVVVLTRPCQYINNEKLCRNENIWGKDQYNKELVNELKEVILYYIKEYKTPKMAFIAYDNAAPMAYLLSNIFNDVQQITTVSGILDVEVYAKRNDVVFNDISSIKRAQSNAESIKQVHFVGGKDKITSPQIANRFISQMKNPKSVQLKSAPNMDHDNWDKITIKY